MTAISQIQGRRAAPCLVCAWRAFRKAAPRLARQRRPAVAGRSFRPLQQDVHRHARWYRLTWKCRFEALQTSSLSKAVRNDFFGRMAEAGGWP